MKRGHLTYRNYDIFGNKVPKQGVDILCSDGKRRRTMRIAEENDTYFSIPATIQANGKTITGFLTTANVQFPDGEDKDLVFIPYKYNKNCDVLPEWKSDKYGTLQLPESYSEPTR